MEKSKVIYGPPGTGKTTRLVQEVKNLVTDGYNPADIAIVSYTKAAAKEIAGRVGVAGVRAQTLHSLSYRLAGVIPDQVFNKQWAEEFFKASQIKITMGRKDEIEELEEGDTYAALYGYARATLNTDYKDIWMKSPAEGSLQRFMYFVEMYENFKRAYGVIDFSDMISDAVGLDPEAKVLIIDESQDFSNQQWSLVRSWLPFVETMIIAGDDDQAIYKWSGAEPSGMYDFEQEYGLERVVLDQSHRIPKSVHRLAEKIISEIESRVVKPYKPLDYEGEVNKYGSCNQLQFDPAQDTLILVRNHSMREPIEAVLMSKGVPYRTEGGRPGPLDNHFIRAAKAWIKGCYNYDHCGSCMLTDNDINAIRRVAQNLYKHKLNDPEALMGAEITWDRLIYFPHALSVYYRKLWQEYESFNVTTNIRISTIHNSKGREAERVILINGMGQRTAESLDFDSELRTFYVGVTRTQKVLDIVTEMNPMKALL